MLRKTLPVVGVFALLAIACSALAYPTPSAVPVRWELNFIPGELRLYHHQPTDRAYWYFTYTVENRTNRDQTWAPQFTLFTDAGEILASGEGVTLGVTRSIMSMLGNELMMNQYEVIGELFQGREHAKEGLVVWPARNLNITELSLFIAGISGETARVTDPRTGEDVLLRKTLQRNYTIPGNPGARGSTPVELDSHHWIFR